MAFKLYTPSVDADWGNYWNRTTIEKNVLDCETDGLLPLLFKYLPKDGKILEAGCGLGKWIIFLKRKGFDISGIDSYKGVVRALKKYDKNFPVLLGKVEKLSMASQSYDAYLSFGVIEHFEQGPQKALKEAFRVLKSGAVAIIETPYDNTLRQLVRLYDQILTWTKLPVKLFLETFKVRPKRQPTPKYFYEYRYSRRELADFVSLAGFKLVVTQPKDDLSKERSIGLWLDFPSLRANNKGNFYLNTTGRAVKFILSPVPWFWSACVVVVAKKV